MNEFSSEVSSPEISNDSGNIDDVGEAEISSEAGEYEIDDDLLHELNDSYDSYMNEDERETFSDTFNRDVEQIRTDETDKSISDDLESELDMKYDLYIEDKKLSSFEKRDGLEIDNVESKFEHIKCRNENLEGYKHPETGVLFERKQVEVDGKQYEVVTPEFESFYDVQIPENMYKATDREQFKECNLQLRKEVVTNRDLRELFDDEQLEQIEDGETPDGYTWHHDAEVGKMQLVDTEMHQRTGHTGGRSIWGGGTENR